MLSLILLDDTALHNQQLSIHLKTIIADEKLDAEVVLATTDAKQVLDFARSSEGPNAYFLDIELEAAFNGLDICRKVHAVDKRACIVYVSAHRHHAMACLKSHAFDFLDKPFTQDALRECLLSVIVEVGKHQGGAVVSFTIGSRTVMLEQASIAYFSVRGNSVTAHMAGQSTFVARSSFSELIPSLETGQFVQIHRNLLVNLRHVREVRWTDDVLVLDNGETLAVSRRSKRQLRDVFELGV